MAIPHVIHYCWFGDKEKNQEMLDCITSWQKLCPTFTFKEWGESNFDITSSLFVREMYAQKRFAFVADYVRLYALEQEGGFYLDTDMLLVQTLEPLGEYDCVLGEESPGIISAGMIGASAHHPFIQACKQFYDEYDGTLVTIPRVLSEVYGHYERKDLLKVYPPKTFYPFSSETISSFYGQDLGKEVIGVHLWNYSWGHPLNKFFKRIGIYTFGKRITEVLGIKKILKKLLGFI